MNAQRKHFRALEHRTLTDACYTTTYPHVENKVPGQEEDSAYLKALVLARTDGEARIALVEQLKAQVEAGVYSCNNYQLARLLQASPTATALMGLKKNEIFVTHKNK
ncbi:hypothetical protein [Dictyobacter formicarum]|uniref:Uncharacterized protein n=1 Tax=Dictyobacter formicarum TaxID=2778368 RepID=A0ABQ3VCC6_9CHLR|nr:hypothetical protein [Dictyobacter formicarum]GHO83434.1 hypothetical protein KSZ_14400 [Dictyobacter formicarum]